MMACRETEPLYPEPCTLGFYSHNTHFNRTFSPSQGPVGSQEDLDLGEAELNCQTGNKAEAKQWPKTEAPDKISQGDHVQTQGNN